MLTDFKSVSCLAEDLQDDSEMNFRMVNTVEAESRAWQEISYGVQRLFKPIAVNPLLYRKDSLFEELQENRGHAFAVSATAAYSRHHSFRNTYLTDPPSKVCRIELMYEEDRLAPDGYRIQGYGYRGCTATVRSGQALTLGDLINGALGSLHTIMGKERSTDQCNINIAEEQFFLARKTSEVGKNHHYRLLFQHGRDGIGLPPRRVLIPPSTFD